MITATFAPPARAPLAAQMGPLTCALLAMAVAATAAGTFDTRLFNGVPVWDKPLKFALSLALYAATLGFVVARLSPAWRNGRVIGTAMVLAITCALFEAVYIFLMAGRGQASHFNDTTPLASILYGLMGVGATLLIVAVALTGLATARDRQAHMSPGLRAGIVQGFALAAVLTLIIGFTLAGNAGHFVGIPGPDARTLPLLGWSASVGDLRPPHFFALHAMQSAPLLGWALDRAGTPHPARWVAAGMVLWTALTLALFAQALAGQPMIAL